MPEPDVNELFLKKLTTGNIPAYYDYLYYDPGSIELKGKPSFQPQLLSPEEIKNNMGFSIDTVYLEDVETYEFISRIVVNEIDKNALQGFVFYDEWFFDEPNFKMTKKVKAYSPVRIFFRDDVWEGEAEPMQRMIGFIILTEKLSEKENVAIEKRMKLFKKIEYEFLLINEDILIYKSDIADANSNQIEKNHNPLLNSYSRSKFINSIYAQIFSQKADAMDYETGKKLSLEEIRKRTGERIETVKVSDYDDNEMWKEMVVKREFKDFIYQINSVIFIEEWYIDEKTLRIKKVVKGIVPVRWYYDQEDFEQINPKKMKLFQVNFNQ